MASIVEALRALRGALLEGDTDLGVELADELLESVGDDGAEDVKDPGSEYEAAIQIGQKEYDQAQVAEFGDVDFGDEEGYRAESPQAEAAEEAPTEV